MKKYLEIFLKSVATTLGISFIGGIFIIVRIMLTYNDTLQSIDKRISNIEIVLLNGSKK